MWIDYCNIIKHSIFHVKYSIVQLILLYIWYKTILVKEITLKYILLGVGKEINLQIDMVLCNHVQWYDNSNENSLINKLSLCINKIPIIKPIKLPIPTIL